MTISIGTSTQSSAWETHAAWLRLRGDCQQLFDHVVAGANRRELEDDKVAVLESRDVIARLEPGSGVNILV
ncbi:hypothetical protein ACWT_5327 [Actinoplanes sp. SE50]|uniref:hypothetical protein n=1 Tax=unclassified Actinoplanes TaxID=2626549 RepID=UPI00023EC14E|nr:MULTISPECIES: hypothetical protein [unclassified Actinoplanes]AEV86345.1 hypothetical protein ACPL_5458 [Actinoplanes sp. SE50/110]ATO84742.1 hypothetical protein ACWT_5327 [Actinoplanes sp. SE50]SLM02152.1 hypothetical protein ACSP50_5390 [Actinoplanes sp. SE50/110]